MTDGYKKLDRMMKDVAFKIDFGVKNIKVKETTLVERMWE